MCALRYHLWCLNDSAQEKKTSITTANQNIIRGVDFYFFPTNREDPVRRQSMGNLSQQREKWQKRKKENWSPAPNQDQNHPAEPLRMQVRAGPPSLSILRRPWQAPLQTTAPQTASISKTPPALTCQNPEGTPTRAQQEATLRRWRRGRRLYSTSRAGWLCLCSSQTSLRRRNATPGSISGGGQNPGASS